MNELVSEFKSRSDLLLEVSHHLERAGVIFAFQGARLAPETWAQANDERDLDIWVASQSAERLTEIMRTLGLALVAASQDVDWLSHRVYSTVVGGRPAVVDFTIGQLMVGPTVLCPESRIELAEADGRRRLAGWAAVGDLILRPLFRGGTPSSERLSEGLGQWRQLPTTTRAELLAHLSVELGATRANEVEQFLIEGGRFPNLRRSAIARTLRQRRSRVLAWRHRRALTSGSHFSRKRRRRTVVVLLGTDGTGKTSTVEHLAKYTGTLGIPARRVYFGRGRGNLPGIARLRSAVEAREERAASSRGNADPSWAARLAPWYYAVEFAIRYWMIVHVWLLLNRGVVFLDRFVYDLRTMEHPSSGAVKLAERLVPLPDVMVLLDPPTAEIIRRKTERAPATIDRHQRIYRDVLDDAPGSVLKIAVSSDLSLHEVVRELTTFVVPHIFRSEVASQVLPGYEAPVFV